MPWRHGATGVYPSIHIYRLRQNAVDDLEGDFVKGLILTFRTKYCEFCDGCKYGNNI